MHVWQLVVFPQQFVMLQLSSHLLFLIVAATAILYHVTSDTTDQPQCEFLMFKIYLRPSFRQQKKRYSVTFEVVCVCAPPPLPSAVPPWDTADVQIDQRSVLLDTQSYPERFSLLSKGRVVSLVKPAVSFNYSLASFAPHWLKLFYVIVVCLVAFLSYNSEVHPVFGEKVVCATVFQHLYVYYHTHKCSVTRLSGSCTPTAEISIKIFVMSWRLL